MGTQPSLLYRLFSWLIGVGKPVVRESNLQVLRIPADGSPPDLVRLNTIESDDNVDSFLRHIPDFRPYWGTQDGLRWRDIARLEVTDRSPPELNGIYFGWKSFAQDLMPLSEHTGFWGDAFIAKTPPWEVDENGAAYEDVPVAFLRSPLLGVALEKLRNQY